MEKCFLLIAEKGRLCMDQNSSLDTELDAAAASSLSFQGMVNHEVGMCGTSLSLIKRNLQCICCAAGIMMRYRCALCY